MADFLDTMVIPRLKEGGQLAKQYRLGELIQLVMERIPIDTVYASIPHEDGYGFHIREIGVLSVSIVPTNREILKDKIEFNAPRPQPLVEPPVTTPTTPELPVVAGALSPEPVEKEYFDDPIPNPQKRGRGRPKGSTKKPALTEVKPLPEPQRIAGPGRVSVEAISSDNSDKFSRFGERF